MSGHTVLHDDQLGVDVDLVRLLLGRSAPALARMPVRELAASGSSNALFRLGDDLLVRLPLQAGGSQSIRKEARWSPYVAPHLPVPCPEVLLVGDPGAGYPEHWSVLRWLPGRTPSGGRPGAGARPRHPAAGRGARGPGG
ncbi:MAG: phosphotransferase, partial [Nocardioides sp.]|nr:phosphotransferase [Nocardioides sp.]